VHRAENTDDPARLAGIVAALGAVAAEVPVVFPAHPRTRGILARTGLPVPPAVRVIDPVGYMDVVRLQGGACAILTDSGGVQKEAYWLGVPCVTLRDETEWVETVQVGWNVLAGADTGRIVAAARSAIDGRRPTVRPALYGDGRAAGRIVELLLEGVPTRSSRRPAQL
jgi:UDP-GlcNAc3NAcA epimerase